MKLIFCDACSDIVALKQNIDRSCDCGKSGGRYIDGLNAEIWGPCTKLGFSNRSFAAAVINQILNGDSTEKMAYGTGYVTKGRDFQAFIIPESAETMKRIDKNNS